MSTEKTEGYVIRFRKSDGSWSYLFEHTITNDLQKTPVFSLKVASATLKDVRMGSAEIVRVRRVAGADIWCRYADSNFRITKNNEVMSVSDGYWIEHRSRGKSRWEVCEEASE